ncbi:MAG: choice-of-anchor B family protein [Balneola sp.]|nr:MAG: choice-of-anchor B family protein [Balneola sp.]
MKRISILFYTFFIALTVQFAFAQTTPDGVLSQMQGFGQAVEISNGNVFIGEPNNIHIPGAVYIFTKDGDNWIQSNMIKAEDGDIGDSFGSSLSANGNLLMVGAPDRNDGEGGAYIFAQANDGTWSQLTMFTVASDSAISSAGSDVALGNGYAFVGIPSLGTGAVVVYKEDDGNWLQDTIIMNPDTAEADFGSAIDIDGMNLLIGAPTEDGGAAFVYSMDEENNWALSGTLKYNSLTEESRFASEVAIMGDLAVIGAYRNNSIGTAFLYRQTEGSWAPAGQLAAFDQNLRNSFGYSIAIAENEVLVGAVNANAGTGAIYRFPMDEDGNWTGSSRLESSGQQPGDFLGASLAADGGVVVTGLIGGDFRAGKAAILELDEDGNWMTSNVVISEPIGLLDPVTEGKVDCDAGAAGIFGCEQVNLISFLPTRDVGGDRGVRLNDIWGWEDPETGKEYALVGRSEGTSFVDLSDPSNPVYVANLPMTEGARANVWRDIKVYKDHAYIVADGAGQHGMQVVDLTKLRAFDGEPLLLEEDFVYDNVASAHNVVINEETGFAYIVGARGGGTTCGGGLHMVNIQDPKNPEFAGCFADPSTGRSGTGYSHDAQCVVYNGPDEEHSGKEICVGANETAISVADVTDKENPIALSTGSYPDFGYVHQGWFTDDHRYFYQNDELDELMGTVEQTRTIIWDLSDLDDPQVLAQFLNDNASSDHNLYIKDNLMYQSNYVSGLQVFDISDAANPEKVAYFDTFPFTEDAAGFSGTWSNYPYFKSGVVIMTSGTEGLFVLETTPELINR